MLAIQSPLLHGYLAVSVFLVLSGFLLAMPVVTNGLALRAGVRGFLWRRSLRILPPYYAAYLLDMVFYAGAHWLGSITGRDPGGTVWHQMEVGYRWPSVGAHLLLVHNTSDAWVQGMDSILWSVGCEWQIYLLFALVLVPLWRWAGLGAMLTACAVLAGMISEASARGWCVYYVPWMVAIFGIGIAAAVVVCGSGVRQRAMRSWPWGGITAAMFAITCAAVWYLDGSVAATMRPTQVVVPYYAASPRLRWIYDVLAALTAAECIVWLAIDGSRRGQQGSTADRVRRLLESFPLLGLGLFAYSLYLTQGLAITFLARAAQSLWGNRPLHWVVMMCGGMLLSLALGYAFYLCVERHSMSRETRRMFAPGTRPRPDAGRG